MKLVQINAVYKIGSTGRNTLEMHEYCIKHGIESHVFCSNMSDEKQNIYKIGSKFDHKLHALWSRIFGKQAFFSHSATRMMLRKINTIHPDVVILGNLHSNYVNLPMLLGYLAKKNISTIVVMHDCWFFTGHCTHYFSIGCDKWQTECKNCSMMKEDNASLFFDTSNFMFRHKKYLFNAIPRLGVIGVSGWITNEAKKSAILANAKIFQRVYNWIDLNKFYPRDTKKLKEKLGIKNEFVVLGVATSWNEHKGLSHFIKVAKNLPNIKVILVGRLDEEIPLMDNLKCIGRTASVDELAEYYSLADVLLVCSPQETFGKVSAEALACGTPVIANDRTANPEIVGDECGFIVHDNNDMEIYSAIERLREIGKTYYKDKCIERANNLFRSTIQIEKYLNVAIFLLKQKVDIIINK